MEEAPRWLIVQSVTQLASLDCMSLLCAAWPDLWKEGIFRTKETYPLRRTLFGVCYNLGKPCAHNQCTGRICAAPWLIHPKSGRGLGENARVVSQRKPALGLNCVLSVGIALCAGSSQMLVLCHLWHCFQALFATACYVLLCTAWKKEGFFWPNQSSPLRRTCLGWGSSKGNQLHTTSAMEHWAAPGLIHSISGRGLAGIKARVDFWSKPALGLVCFYGVDFPLPGRGSQIVAFYSLLHSSQAKIPQVCSLLLSLACE